jgi:hypothetical protein
LYSECVEGGTFGEGEGWDSSFIFWGLSYLSEKDCDEEFGGIRNQGTDVGIAGSWRFERFLDQGSELSRKVCRMVFIYQGVSGLFRRTK